MTTAMMIAGRSRGSSTQKKIWRLLAPITRAALMSCGGSAEKPDRKIRKVSAVHYQMSAKMIAHCAASGSDRQRIRGFKPNRETGRAAGRERVCTYMVI